MRRRTLLALALASQVLSMPALADDLADEADFLFERGAAAYRRGDYESALERFLASNRLVSNHNVVFNIAYTYQRLGRYPEAFRYFSEARQAERDAAQLARIDEALAQIRQHVAVLRVETDPPNATIYIDRKDLGARGTTPQILGLAPGDYEIIAERPGYQPERRPVRAIAAGEERVLSLALAPILGHVRVDGPLGTLAASASEPERACRVPCTLDFRPGMHRLVLSRAGFRTAELGVDIDADQTAVVQAELERRMGNLVVTTDEPGTRIDVDGDTMGFTPAVLPLAVGRHRVRLARPGYRTVERNVEVTADREHALSVVLSEQAEVTSVSRVRERVEDAPSSVSIISAEELRAFQYPTLAEALRSVPGVYVWDDRSYAAIGIRGVSQLGSYGNRVLVLSDGQPLNDDWLGSSYVGYDARADLGDVERIEVVRGPGSVVYGNSAFSGVINVITRPVARRPTLEVGVGAVGDGVARARVRADAPFPGGGGIWTSFSAARGVGRDFFFPELAAHSNTGGYARGVDGFDAATLQGRATRGDLSLQWFWTAHDKQLPTGVFLTELGDARARQRDSRALVEFRAEPRLSASLTSLSRVHGNLYRFNGKFPRLPDDGGIETDTFRGAWVGIEQRLEWKPSDRLRAFAGGELQRHFQVDQYAANEHAVLLDESGNRGHPFWIGAAYASFDVQASPRLALHAAGRLDAYSTFGSAFNPRLALVYRPYEAGNLKLLAAKAFRAPSVYELYYNDGGLTQVESPDLGPEHILSLELEWSHDFTPLLTGTLSLFQNYVSDLVVSRGMGTPEDPLHYVNSRVPLQTLGSEIGIRRDSRHGVEFAASYGFVLAHYLADGRAGSALALDSNPDFRKVANVPSHVLVVKGRVPLFGSALRLATRFVAETGRFDRFDRADDEAPQRRTGGALIWDLVLSGLALPNRGADPSLEWAVGVYNAFDYRYSTPVSAEFLQRSIEQSGRTLLLSGVLTL